MAKIISPVTGRYITVGGTVYNKIFGRKRLRNKSRKRKSPISKSHSRRPFILFTLTTFLSRPDKLKQSLKALKSIEKYEPDLKKYCYILVINECGKVKGNFLKKDFPWIDRVINKNNKCGQAGSLNIAIDELYKNKKKYKYWIHWEESWVAVKPFLEIGIEVMEKGVSQLQFTEDGWMDDYEKKIRLKNRKYIYIQKKHSYSNYKICKRKKYGKSSKNYIPNIRCNERDPDKYWPLWSLRPGIDQVDKVLKVGYFTTDKRFWPVHFELEWAYNWVQLNTIKAGIELVKRQKGHRSFSEENI